MQERCRHSAAGEARSPRRSAIPSGASAGCEARRLFRRTTVGVVDRDQERRLEALVRAAAAGAGAASTVDRARAEGWELAGVGSGSRFTSHSACGSSVATSTAVRLGSAVLRPTRMPSPRAIAATSSSIRLLPMPAAPSTTRTASDASKDDRARPRTTRARVAPMELALERSASRSSGDAYPWPSTSFSNRRVVRCAGGASGGHIAVPQISTSEGLQNRKRRPKIVLIHWRPGTTPVLPWSDDVAAPQRTDSGASAAFPAHLASHDVARLSKVLEFSRTAHHSWSGALLRRPDHHPLYGGGGGTRRGECVGLVYIAAFRARTRASRRCGFSPRGRFTPSLAQLHRLARLRLGALETNSSTHSPPRRPDRRRDLVTKCSRSSRHQHSRLFIGVPAWSPLPSWESSWPRTTRRFRRTPKRLFRIAHGRDTVEVRGTSGDDCIRRRTDLVEKARPRVVGKGAVV